VTKHLRVLERAGLVRALKQGRKAALRWSRAGSTTPAPTSIGSPGNGTMRWPG